MMNFENFTSADFATGFIGGLGSVALIAIVGRYLATKIAQSENGKLIGFCLAMGLALGRGAIIRGSPSPKEVELFGRAVGSWLGVGGLWLLWFKRRSDPEQRGG